MIRLDYGIFPNIYSQFFINFRIDGGGDKIVLSPNFYKASKLT